MDFWPILFDVGALLGVAFVLGAFCERLKQSALLGYLLAGMLLGPNAFDVVSGGAEVDGLAEVGVCLLLFSLGLEFSWRRLRALGGAALAGGAIQVSATLCVIAVIAYLAGLSLSTAIVIGAAFALSSTAGVLRVLMARSEVDSVHGRHALGILLFQDLAVIPLVLLTGFLGASGEDSSGALESLGRTGLLLFVMIVSFYVVFNHVVPRVLLATSALQNRELPVLFAVVVALCSIYVAHEFGLSPAVGAFIAGMLLGESPFATQVRSDLSVLRTLLVTVFFSSIGMLANPSWILEHAGLVLLVAVVVVVVKAFVCCVGLVLVRQRPHPALAAGICLSQVGEFAFVIADSSRGTLIDNDLFMVIVSTMMVTLCMTPYLIASASGLSLAILRQLAKLGFVKPPACRVVRETGNTRGHVVLIGYGPAGERAAEVLRGESVPLSVLDLNPILAAQAEADGFEAHVGDGTHPEVLEHLHVQSAATVVVALPDPRAVERAVRAIRSEAPEVPIIVRSRYHRHSGMLEEAGATAAVDEEQDIGSLLGARAATAVRESAASIEA